MSAPRMPILSDRKPAEVLVYDGSDACSYLPERRARLPLRLPIRALQAHELDARLAEGDRRHGVLLYRPECSPCRACEAIRLDVGEYALRATQRRVLRRGDGELRMERGQPRADAAAVSLYDRHRFGRGLAGPDAKPMTQRAYARFLVETCCASEELRFYLGDELIAVAILDHGEQALSAVYCHHAPEHGRWSLGTYAILKQLELAREAGLRYLYLGLYVGGCSAMEYKARFLPHERRIDGEWRRFSRS